LVTVAFCDNFITSVLLANNTEIVELNTVDELVISKIGIVAILTCDKGNENSCPEIIERVLGF